MRAGYLFFDRTTSKEVLDAVDPRRRRPSRRRWIARMVAMLRGLQ
jgi:hypothetical protein